MEESVIAPTIIAYRRISFLVFAFAFAFVFAFVFVFGTTGTGGDLLIVLFEVLLVLVVFSFGETFVISFVPE